MEDPLQLVDGGLTLEVAPWTIKALARAELRDRVESLRLWTRGSGGPAALRALAVIPMPALERITLVDSSYLGAKELAALARFDAAPRLRGLRLEQIRIGPDIAELLTDPARLGWIRDLAIIRAGLFKGTLARLLSSPLGERLESLDLFGNRLGASGASLIARAPALAGLRSLELPDTGMNPAGVEAIASSQTLGQLEHLVLSSNAIGDEGARSLARSPLLARLRSLELHNAEIGRPGARALVAAGSPRALEHLGLWNNRVGAAVAAKLARSDRFPSLVSLDLRGTGIGDAGAVALADGRLLATVETLRLDANKIGDRGSAALAGSPHLVRLASLTFADNPIGIDGVLAMRASRSPAVRRAVEHTAPDVEVPWPSAPLRAAMDEAWAATAGLDEGAGEAALEALIAKGILPQLLAGDARRRFRAEQLQACATCGGNFIDGAGDPCPYCVDGREIGGSIDTLAPPTVDRAVAFAADAAVIADLERHAEELALRVGSFRGAPVAHSTVVWWFYGHLDLGMLGARCLDPILEALEEALGERMLHHRRGHGWPLWASHCWTIAAREPESPFAKHLDPFAPYAAIRAHGYDADIDGDAVLLLSARALCPAPKQGPRRG